VKRRELLLLLGSVVVAAHALRAQQKAMPVIGFLSGASPVPTAPYVAAFLHGLRETGYIEGQNVVIHYRWAEDRSDRLPALAADLVASNVDVIAALLRHWRQKTLTQPSQSFFGAGDPIGLGLVAGLARPGGNLTGVSSLDLTPKRVEMVCELVPGAKLIAVLVNPNNAGAEHQIQSAKEAARVKGVQLRVLEASTESEIDAAFVTLVQLQTDALVLPSDPSFNSRLDQLVALAARNAIPAIYDWPEFAVAGGLISYGPSRTATWHRCGVYVGKILNGAKPADLPVEQPTRFELVVNLKTAKALGLTIPPSILARADEVIE
jgi:putative ABC transport system substrate-binding protein